MPGKHHLRGFKIAKTNRLAATMVSICVSRCQENITYGGSKIAPKNRLAASRLVDNGLHCVVDARKHHLRGFKIAKKSARASRLVDNGLHCVVDARKTSLMGVPRPLSPSHPSLCVCVCVSVCELRIGGSLAGIAVAFLINGS